MNAKSASLVTLAALVLGAQVAPAQTFPKVSFTAPQKAAINTNGLGVPVAIGDVNNDGNTDLLIRNHLLLGDGTGQFQLSSIDESAIAGPYLQYTALPFKDLNGDGNLDYVRFDPPFDQAGQCPSYPLVITVLLGDSLGHFTTSVTYNRPSSTNVSAAFGDYDGDGKTDFAVATLNDVCDSSGNQTVTREITTFLNNGNGTFRMLEHFLPNEAGPNNLVAGDFNGDGKTDLAYTAYTYLQGPQVYRIRTEIGYGDGTFQEGPVYVLDSEVYEIGAGDLNGDGRTDLVAYLGARNSPGAQPRIASLIAQPNGQFRWLSALSVVTPPNSSNYIDRIQTPLIDLNGDGKLDLFVPTLPSTNNNMVIAVASGNGTGNLSAPQRFVATQNAPTDVLLFPLTVGAPPSILYDSNDGQSLYVLKNLSK